MEPRNDADQTLAFLLQIGADQTLEDDDGFTALHHAVSAGSYEVTATLLRHGADAAHAASDGPTPKELAAEAAAADRHADARRIAELFIAGPGGSDCAPAPGRVEEVRLRI